MGGGGLKRRGIIRARSSFCDQQAQQHPPPDNRYCWQVKLSVESFFRTRKTSSARPYRGGGGSTTACISVESRT